MQVTIEAICIFPLTAINIDIPSELGAKGARGKNIKKTLYPMCLESGCRSLSLNELRTLYGLLEFSFSFLSADVQGVVVEMKKILLKREKETERRHPHVSISYKRGIGLEVTLPRGKIVITYPEELSCRNISIAELKKTVELFRGELEALSQDDIPPSTRNFLVALEKVLARRPKEADEPLTISRTALPHLANLRAVMKRGNSPLCDTVEVCGLTGMDRLVIYEDREEYGSDQLSRNELVEVVRQLREQLGSLNPEDVPETCLLFQRRLETILLKRS